MRVARARETDVSFIDGQQCRKGRMIATAGTIYIGGGGDSHFATTTGGRPETAARFAFMSSTLGFSGFPRNE
jgi:hypothetical protein